MPPQAGHDPPAEPPPQQLSHVHQHPEVQAINGRQADSSHPGARGPCPLLCQLPRHHLGRPSMLCTELFWEIRIRPRDSPQMSVSLQDAPQAAEREAGVTSTWRTTSTITPDPCSLLSPPPAFTLLWVLIAETDVHLVTQDSPSTQLPARPASPLPTPSLCALQSRPAGCLRTALPLSFLPPAPNPP